MSRIKQLGVGFSYIHKGFSFFLGHKKLWWYAVIPTTINLIVLILMIFLLAHYFDHLTGWIFGSGGGQGDTGLLAKTLGWFLSALVFIAKVIIFIILLTFLLIVTFVFSMILAGPFNDTLSEKVEQMATGREEIPFSWKIFAKSIRRSIIVELEKAAFFLSVPLLLLVINVIPGVGSAVYLVLASLFAAFDIGFNFVDYPMSRKLMTFGQRMKIGWSKRYYITGFGIVALIPLFPYIFSAPLVVGGTLLFDSRCENTSGSRTL